jgi:O-antigen/teichoic acid export membrane protein
VSNVYGIQVMLNLKMDKLFLRITAYGALVSICSNFLLIPLYSGLGSAFSLLVTELFITLACAFFLFKENINLFNRDYFHPRKLLLQIQSVLPASKNKH